MSGVRSSIQGGMLRITIRDGPVGGTVSFCLILEGRIAGEWICELEKVWTAMCEQAGEKVKIEIECSSVSYISHAGAALLSRMRHEGAKLVAKTPLMTEYIEDCVA